MTCRTFMMRMRLHGESSSASIVLGATAMPIGTKGPSPSRRERDAGASIGPNGLWFRKAKVGDATTQAATVSVVKVSRPRNEIVAGNSAGTRYGYSRYDASELPPENFSPPVVPLFRAIEEARRAP